MKTSARQHTVETEDGGTISLRLTRGLAIRLFCTECLGWEGNPKSDCTSRRCPLYPFRGYTRAAQKGGE
jgi:hypothetical protein